MPFLPTGICIQAGYCYFCIMEELVRSLHEKNASLAVRSRSGAVSFHYGRGVSDLARLINRQPEILQDAEVADKVVGKGAAALMIKAGVKNVHGDVVSNAAMELFKMYGTGISYDSLVPHIINRKKDGQCPVETLCGDCTDIDELYGRISAWLAEHSSAVIGG